MSHVGDTELIEQDDDEEYLYCGICMHKYDLHLMRPKILPCSHTYCYTCLKVKYLHNYFHLLIKTDSSDNSVENPFRYRKQHLEMPIM